jgi:hypothetical protein
LHESDLLISCYSGDTGLLKTKFESLFRGFNSVKYYSPFSMSSIILKHNKAIEGVHVEVIEFQCDWALKETFSDSRLSRFFTNLPGHSFPNIIQFDFHVHAIFPNTYLCYKFLPFIKRNKSSEILRLTDTHAMNMVQIRKYKPHITRNEAVFREIFWKVLYKYSNFSRNLI